MRTARTARAALVVLALLPAAPARSASPSTQRALTEIVQAEDARRLADGTLARYLRAAEPGLRARAALAVGRLQDSTTVPLLLPLTADLDPAVRREAVFALGQIGHRSAGARLVSRLVDPDAETLDLAIEALGKLGDRRWTARVAEFLHDHSEILRGEAAVALWRLADSTALDALLDAHQDPDPEVRWRVLYALEKIPSPDRVALVAASHLQDPSARVRAFAARTLGRQKAGRAVAYLCDALGDPDVDVVVNAERALQAIGDTLACPELATALGHRHPYVRVTAATALGVLHGAVAADSLAAHLADPDAATRGACARSLLQLRGEAALAPVGAVLEDSSVYARAGALDGLRFLPAAAVEGRLRAGLDDGRHLLERITCAEVAGAVGARGLLDALRAGLANRDAPHAGACADAIAALKDGPSLPQVAQAYVAHLADTDADARLSLSAALDSLGGKSYADSVRRAHPAPAARASGFLEGLMAPTKVRGAVIVTGAGEIEIQFYSEQAPQTVKNFARLARRGLLDGGAFHRVVPSFVIQDGDPTGTGWGGPGYTIRCEYNRLRYEPGMVGMALSGKDTGGSQWFITHTPQMHLNGRYTIFARVVRGMDVVGRVVQGERIVQVRLVI